MKTIILFLALTILSGCPGATSSTSDDANSNETETPTTWRSCLLDTAPSGACFGPNDTICDPDRLMDPERFDYAPEEVPEALASAKPLRIHWHIIRKDDGRDDIDDGVIAAQLNNLNTFFASAAIVFETKEIHRYDNTALSSCAPQIDLGILEDTERSLCGTAGLPDLAMDTKAFVNIYIVDIAGLGGFSPPPCVLPPGDSRHGIYVDSDAIQTTDDVLVVHEMGHFLGLLHAFHNWNWAANIPNSVCADEENDFIKDTPPQNKTVDFGGSLDCDAPPSTCGDEANPDSVRNVMQYTSCANAMNASFTAGQFRRMQWSLLEERAGLIDYE